MSLEIKSGRWTTSFNGEHFNGEVFETKEEAIEFMKNDLSAKDLADGFYVGKIKEHNHLAYWDVTDMLDAARERAYEDTEYAEEWLTDIPAEQIQELNDVVANWFRKYNHKPTWYSITDSEKIVVTSSQEERI